MNKSKLCTLILFAIIAIVSAKQLTYAELVVQINYQSRQIMQDGKPTMLIDPNLTIIVGDRYINRNTTRFIDHIGIALSCNSKQVVQGVERREFFSGRHHQSHVELIEYGKIWPENIWSWLTPNWIQPKNAHCQYNWQYRLYRANNLQPLLTLGDADFMRNSPHQHRQSNILLQSNFTVIPTKR